MCDLFKPCLIGFADGDHFADFLSDYRLIDQSLAEDDSLVRPFQAFFGDGSAFTDVSTGHGKSLVVEIAHDDDETIVLLTHKVVNRNLTQ